MSSQHSKVAARRQSESPTVPHGRLNSAEKPLGVPDYESLMHPVLDVLSDSEHRSAAALREGVATKVGLNDEDRGERIPSGSRVFDNRVHWAVTYLVQAGCVERPRRGIVTITDRGRDVLRDHHDRIDSSILEQFPEFIEFKNRAGKKRKRVEGTARAATSTVPTTPKERLSEAVQEADGAVADELIRRIRELEPAFLEDVVLELLTAMGYGGKEGAAEHLGRSGDEGLDGVIRQDALGLDRIYVQAKRYAAKSSIGRPDIQAFVGALHGAQADRGVFITTSRFTDEARVYAERVNARLVLIDGDDLGDLMVRHNVGVQIQETFTLKEIDEDYFEA